VAESRKPKSSPATKILDQQREWIRELRKRRLGSRRIQSQLKRVHNFNVSRTTIDKVLRAIDVQPLSRPRRLWKGRTRYARLIPGERIQMDTSKIAPGVYTAIDDCTRVRVLALYPRRSADNSLLFLERVIEEMPFPVQAIQTDRGREFFAYCFQEKLMQYAIKFRPIKPASPHLNGKVETFPAHRSGRVLLDCRFEEPRSSTAFGGMAGSLQPVQAAWIVARPNTVGGLVGAPRSDPVPGRSGGQLL